MAILHVSVPIFDMSVAVCHSVPYQECLSECFAYEGLNSILTFSETSKGSVQCYKGDVWVYLPNLDSASVVIHEMVHVAFAICEIKGIQPDEELICYLTGWLKREIVDVLYEAQ